MAGAYVITTVTRRHRYTCEIASLKMPNVIALGPWRAGWELTVDEATVAWSGRSTNDMNNAHLGNMTTNRPKLERDGIPMDELVVAAWSRSSTFLSSDYNALWNDLATRSPRGGREV